MDEQGRRRPGVWTPLLFSLVMITGMVIGFNLHDTLRNKRSLTEVLNRNDRLEEIIDLINERYVDTINSDSIYESSISGILKSLDPHTVYIPADELQDVNNDLEGSFSGIGVEFAIVKDTVEVTSVVDNGPAAQAGLELGDKLVRVNDTLVAGNGITADRIMGLLKGQKSTSVAITVKNVTTGALTQHKVTRGDIPLYSIDASIMLDSVTGYIKINRFSATTYNEFKSAIKKLQAQGAGQLVLDLRGNPGGYLSAAVSIADEMLDENKLIVYTQGLHSTKSEFKSTPNGLFENGKVAVLVNEGSASASEVLAGALQDWDRGIIVGRRTFGKGLVQEQYEMSDGAALRLTIARYYTPSGRCIQRSFANGKDAYMHDYEKRIEESAGIMEPEQSDSTVFYTAKHRAVYGGGGITPDIRVPFDTTVLSNQLMEMMLSSDFKNTVLDYFVRNRSKLSYRSARELASNFKDDKQVLASYLERLDNTEKENVMKELAKPATAQYLSLQVKAQLAKFLFRENGYYSIKLTEDKMVIRALEAINSGRYSQLIAGNR